MDNAAEMFAALTMLDMALVIDINAGGDVRWQIVTASHEKGRSRTGVAASKHLH